MIPRIARLFGCCFLAACATDPGDDSASRIVLKSDGGPPPSGFAVDYSIWQLQLPSGGTSPDVIPPSKLATYSDAYFMKADDGGQIFMDPITGVPTGGSTHPRTELREVDANGDGALWSPSGTNTLTVTGKAIECASCTIGQIFNGSASITLAELEYSSDSGGSLKLLYEEAKGTAGTPLDLGVEVPLNQVYTFVLSLSNNRLSVSVDGHSVYSYTPSAPTLADQFYFKAGNYDQEAGAGPVTTSPHSQIENYAIAVTHE